jgi:hypothetical protein
MNWAVHYSNISIVSRMNILTIASPLMTPPKGRPPNSILVDLQIENCWGWVAQYRHSHPFPWYDCTITQTSSCSLQRQAHIQEGVQTYAQFYATG